MVAPNNTLNSSERKIESQCERSANGNVTSKGLRTERRRRRRWRWRGGISGCEEVTGRREISEDLRVLTRKSGKRENKRVGKDEGRVERK